MPDLVEHRLARVVRRAGRDQLRRDAHLPRHGPVRLLSPAASVGELDQPCREQHPDVEVQVPGIDAEPVRELPVRQLVALVGAEGLEDAQPEGVSERLQLFGTLDLQQFAHAI